MRAVTSLTFTRPSKFTSATISSISTIPSIMLTSKLTSLTFTRPSRFISPMWYTQSPLW